MKLLRDEMERTEDADPLELFNQGIRSEVTRYKYTKTLQQVTCVFLEEILAGSFEERVSQLVKYGRDDPKWVRDMLIKLARKLRDRTRLAKDDPDYLNPTTVPMYFKPVKKLFDMNDVAIPWQRIYTTYPELDNMADTAGWSREEIAVMLRHTRDTQARAMILVLASSGVRVGAIPDLNWGDLEPVYRVDGKLTLDPGEKDGELACVALEVYRGSSENYTTFITPEAFAALKEYGREWSEAMSRQPDPKDPMWISTKGVPKRAAYSGVQKRLGRVIRKSGLRTEDKENRRYRVPLMHGFRRYFNKTIKDSPTPDTEGSRIRTEYMMGHKGVGQLDQNYFKTNTLELAKEYVLAVPDLTIDNSDRLKLANRRMAGNIQKMEGEKDEKMARMEKEMARMEAEIAELKKRGNLPGSDLVGALRDAAGAEGVPGAVIESLTGMVDQLGKVQEATIRQMREEYDAKIGELRRALDTERSGSPT